MIYALRQRKRRAQERETTGSGRDREHEKGMSEREREDRKRLDAEMVWEHKTGEEVGGGETDALCGTPDETDLSLCLSVSLTPPLPYTKLSLQEAPGMT